MDIDEFRTKKLLVIRFKYVNTLFRSFARLIVLVHRVCNLLKGWIEKGFDEDFKDDIEMLEMLNNFIERMSIDGLPKESERLQDVLHKKARFTHHNTSLLTVVPDRR